MLHSSKCSEDPLLKIKAINAIDRPLMIAIHGKSREGRASVPDDSRTWHGEMRLATEPAFRR